MCSTGQLYHEGKDYLIALLSSNAGDEIYQSLGTIINAFELSSTEVVPQNKWYSISAYAITNLFEVNEKKKIQKRILFQSWYLIVEIIFIAHVLQKIVIEDFIPSSSMLSLTLVSRSFWNITKRYVEEWLSFK